jgi:hypothetical protein
VREYFIGYALCPKEEEDEAEEEEEEEEEEQRKRRNDNTSSKGNLSYTMCHVCVQHMVIPNT